MDNGGILGILIGLIILGEILRISILVLKMKDLIGIVRTMWCLTRCGGVMGIEGS